MGDLSQICFLTHLPQGFCEIWENERWNLGQKRRFLGWFFFAGLGIALKKKMEIIHSKNYSYRKKLFNKIFIQKKLTIIHSKRLFIFLKNELSPRASSKSLARERKSWRFISTYLNSTLPALKLSRSRTNSQCEFFFQGGWKKWERCALGNPLGHGSNQYLKKKLQINIWRTKF